MNTQYLTQLTVIVLATELSLLAGQAEAPQLGLNSMFNNLPQQSSPLGSNRQIISFTPVLPGRGMPIHSVGSGTR